MFWLYTHCVWTRKWLFVHTHHQCLFGAQEAPKKCQKYTQNVDLGSIEGSGLSRMRVRSWNSAPECRKQQNMNKHTKKCPYTTVCGSSTSEIYFVQKRRYISKLLASFFEIFWKSTENMLFGNPWKFKPLTPRSYKVPAPNLMCELQLPESERFSRYPWPVEMI